jgi:hypothetical protein
MNPYEFQSLGAIPTAPELDPTGNLWDKSLQVHSSTLWTSPATNSYHSTTQLQGHFLLAWNLSTLAKTSFRKMLMTS